MNCLSTKMKFLILPMVSILTISSCTENANTSKQSENCSLLSSISKLEEFNFDFENHEKYLDTKYLPISGKLYDSIFREQAIIEDSSKIIGQFSLPFDRIGVICYNKAYECDHLVDYIDLNIIEKCQIISRYNLSVNDDEVMVFNLRSRISENFDTLFITNEYSSEWVVGDLNPLDTLFIENVAIDLKSKNFDTISHYTKIKKILY